MKSLINKIINTDTIGSMLLLKIFYLFKKGEITPRHLKKYKYIEYFFSQQQKWKRNRGSVDLSAGVKLASFQNHSYLLFANPGNTIESEVIIKGAWEFHILEILSSLIRQNPTGLVLDIGSNIGAIAIPLANMFRSVRFYSFEPHPDIYSKLVNNIYLNSLDNIEPVNLAISDKSGVIDFYAQKNSDNMGLSSIQKNNDIKEFDAIKVEVTTLDEFFSANPQKIALIKVDTQGTELSVLRGARNILIKDSPAIIFEYEDQYFMTEEAQVNTKTEIKAFLESLGYELFAVNDSELKYFPKVTFHGAYQGEIIALRTQRNTHS